jgi:hypothetical protein
MAACNLFHLSWRAWSERTLATMLLRGCGIQADTKPTVGRILQASYYLDCCFLIIGVLFGYARYGEQYVLTAGFMA